MRGRKRIPPQIKILRGTYRPWRENAQAPTPDSVGAEPPEHLNARERQWFIIITARLKEMNCDFSLFTEMQMLLAKRLAEIDECDKAIEKYGAAYRSKPGGTIRRNPAIRVRNTAMRHAHSLLAECGLSPAFIGKFQ